VFDLVLHDADTFVGTGPSYPWGGLYGGQIVAQALRAASNTIDDGLAAHSLRAYYIRPGDAAEPVRYEVDRIRNGRSFATRRVVARQTIGAILNLEASYQREEHSALVDPIAMPAIPGPDELEESSWSPDFVRRFVPEAASTVGAPMGTGRIMAWIKVTPPLPDPGTPEGGLLHRCWLAYLSDDLPCDSVIRAHPRRAELERDQGGRFMASLDHTIWFHRTPRADEWHLYDVSCHHYGASRGVTIGHVLAADGFHLATFAQEALLRVRSHPERPGVAGSDAQR
jgi:acyl-CoA thioesterase II